MFGLLKKSKPQQDVYFPFKTVFEKEQLNFDKKQFASNGFDFVHKQRKRQNKCDDEKWVRSGDRPFTKTKKSNRDVPDQNELQTYASWEKMFDKAIHVVRQLKKKGNTNTSSAAKQQTNSSSLSNSDLKTNVLSSDKSKAVKTTSKALSTRCFKCHRVGHYANKCQKQKSLVTLEKVETEPEKKNPLPIFDDYDMNRMKDLRINLFEEEGNDVPRFVDQSIGANQHGDQDVLNNLTELRLEPRPDDRLPVLKLVFPDQLDILRPMVEPDLAWVVKKPKTDMHSHPADHPDSPASVLIIFRA
uniref:CCHC-type domain-containing protein n=1 Tax=Brassica oleracea var. oleracea TaxID=109376 RepID=A0A0D3E6V5_BRAOL